MGQDLTTPSISSLDRTDLQIEIELMLTELPDFWTPVIMVGCTRWVGLYVDSGGLVGAKYNNSFLTWSTTAVGTGVWHAAQLKYEAGLLQILLDGVLTLPGTTPSRVTISATRRAP